MWCFKAPQFKRLHARRWAGLGLLWFGCWAWAEAKSLPDPLKNTRVFEVSERIQALAISPDEAMIAVAMKQGRSKSLIELYDRQTTKRLTYWEVKQSPIIQLEFDQTTRRLAIAGEDHLQVWNLEELPAPSDSPLPQEFLQWEEDVSGLPPNSVRFQLKTSSVLWPQEEELKQADFTQKPPALRSLWLGAPPADLQSFGFDLNEEWLALSFAQQNQIALVQPQTQKHKPPLDYHLFPVRQVQFVQPNILLSLDLEGNLVWGHVTARVKIHGLALQQTLAPAKSFKFQTIYDDFLAITTHDEERSAWGLQIIQKNEGKSLKHLPLVASGASAVSPTGAYLVTAEQEKQVQLHQFFKSQKPEDYIRKLEELQAAELARRYRNHLENLPPELSMPTNGENSVGENVPPALLENLKAALAAGQWAEASRWVEEILKLEPQNIRARQAQKQLTEHQDLIALQKAKQSLEEGQYETALRLLKQVPKTSPHRTEARQLLDQTEQHLHHLQTLEQAEREINLEKWALAEALLKRVLEKDPENQKAQDLMGQVNRQKAAEVAWDTLSSLIFLGALSFLGLLAFRHRQSWLGWLSMQEKENTPLKPPLKTRASSNLGESSPAQKGFLEMLEKTLDVLKLSQKADHQGRHIARLIDLEAEISVIRKKATASDADFKVLTGQLQVILQTLRSLSFGAEEQTTYQRTQTQEQHNRAHEDRRQKAEEAQREREAQEEKRSHFEREDYSKQRPNEPPPKTSELDYYEVLGVAPEASAEEIKRAYYQKLKEYHPDRHHQSEFGWIKAEAEARTQEVTRAYEVLKETASRRRYDQSRGAA